MKFYKWSQYGGADEIEPSIWSLSFELDNGVEWDLMAGKYIENWDVNIAATYDDEVDPTDYPFTSFLLPVFSPRLKELMESLGVEYIQYLPLKIRRSDGAKEVDGYHFANYLMVIDCLDREKSEYQIWTKENLLFWEKRPYMLGTFRYVKKAVINSDKIRNIPLFRLWGWECMVIVREDVKTAIEGAGITGCVFDEIEII